MKRGIIFAGGEFSLPADFENILKSSTLTVCADSGYDNAGNAGVIPNVIIGDMDSVKRDLPEGIKRIKLNCEKDDTDTQACVDYLADAGCDEMVLVGALGGRIDHALANIMLVIYAAKKGARLIIESEDTEIIPVDSFAEISGKKGDWLSIIPVMGDAEGVTLTGLKYLLDDATLEAGKTVGISNEFVCDKATISVKKGFITAIKTKR